MAYHIVEDPWSKNVELEAGLDLLYPVSTQKQLNDLSKSQLSGVLRN